MRIKNLTLQNFRNYGHLQVSFPGDLNVFIGNNAQGKTNLMECIYLLAMSRSFRTTRDVELVKWDAEEARIKAELERYSGSTLIEGILPRNARKRFRINGQDLARISELLGYLNVVAFTPDDLQLVKGSPSQRRQFLDVEICQISKVYRQDLTKYNQVLNHRNKLLKDILERRAPRSMLEIWDEQLADYGSRIIDRRAKVVRNLAHWGRLMHDAVSGREKLDIRYQPFFLSSEERASLRDCPDREEIRRIFASEIARSREEELRRGVTLVGPQRDDLVFFIDGMEAKVYGSQGQQRSVVLSCKLAELEFMHSVTGEYPVLLLDDVMSELDEHRRSFLMKTVLERVQTFLTSTSFEGVQEEILVQADVFTISSGEIDRSLTTFAG